MGPVMTHEVDSDSSVLRPQLTIFGGLRLHHGGEEVELGPTRQRSVLALLVAARGDVVHLSDITDTLWPDSPPTSALNQIHRHVGELRRLFQPDLAMRAAGRYIHARGRAYRFDPATVDSDLEGFYAIAALAERTEIPDEARHLNLQALALAALPAFSDLPWEILSLPTIARVDRDRRAVASRVLSSTQTRAHAEANVLMLERIASEDPLDEALQAEVMRVLALAGRRAQALELFDRTRGLLAERLGIDPGEELRAVQLEIIREPLTTAPTLADTPRWLPLGVASYIDRVEARRVLDDVTESAGGPGGAIAVLSGMGGVGKTTLAVHWARRVADQFPDGQLYVNMLGYDAGGESFSAAQGTDRLLEQLGALELSESLDARQRHLRSLVEGKRMILLIDNVRDVAQVRPLLVGSAGCLTIVTSRDQLSGLMVREAARSVPLSRWPVDESRKLLVSRLGVDAVESAPAAVESIIESCAGLPLALAIAAARSVLQPTSSMPSMARELLGHSNILDSLSAGDSDSVRATFDWSYRALRPEAGRLFRHLAAHPGPQMSLSSLASCTDRSLDETRALTAELVSANMIVAVAPATFEVHDLLRAYAGELVRSAGEWDVASRQLVSHYVRSTREAFLQFGRSPTVDLGDAIGAATCVDRFTSIDGAIEWYSRERTALRGMIRRAIELGLDRAAGLLSLDWRPMNQTLDLASSSLESCTLAYEAARRSGDLVLTAELARDVGAKLSRVGDLDGANRLVLEALATFKALGDAVGESNTYRNLAGNAARVQDYASELHYSELAVDAGRRSGRADTLCLALACGSFSDPGGSQEAQLEHIVEAYELAVSAGLDYMIPTTLTHLGSHHLDHGNYQLAWDTAERALELQDLAEDHLVDAAVNVLFVAAGSKLGRNTEVALAIEAWDHIMMNHGAAVREGFAQKFADFDAEVTAGRAWIAGAGLTRQSDSRGSGM
ncbi:BTAD domain-containing putative transcriptional regulator [soil metagenome]